MRQLDVVPTVLDLVGLPADGALPGRSLAPVWSRSTGGPDPPAMAHLDYEGRAGIAIRRMQWKLIQPLSAAFAATPELYRVDQDRAESSNLAFELRITTGWLAATGRAAMSRAGEIEAASGAIGREEIEALRALGYVE